MSGAEALAAVGLASNILQFVEFTTELCVRIQEYSSSATGLPKELAQQAAQLRELLLLLKELSQQSNGQVLGDGLLVQCQAQAQELSDLLESLQGRVGKGRLANARVAVRSFSRKPQVDKLQSALDRLVRLLALQLQVEIKRAADRTGSDVSSLLKGQSGLISLLQDFREPKNIDNQSKSVGHLPETPFIIPFSQNPRFVGREVILSQLKDALLKKDENCMPRAVLHGLGGVGKTQIALEYVFLNRDPASAVFWVYANTAPRFVESYQRIASECKIPGRDNPSSDTLQLVRDWLQSQRQFNWLMIIDNVDDRSMFLEPIADLATNKALIEYVPQSGRGSIIYTTRNRDVGIDLASGGELITIDPVNVKEGLMMLGDKITRHSSEADQMELLEELAYLPLAISQATAFMTKSRRTVPNYIQLLRKDSTKSKVLNHRALHHGREDRSSESVIRTWWITFQHIEEENPRSTELLMIMSVLDRQQIPLVLFQDPAEDNLDFEEAVGLLEAFSLITLYPALEVCNQKVVDMIKVRASHLANPICDFCDMHRLVQTSTREWLAQSNEVQRSIATTALRLILDIFLKQFNLTAPVSHLLYPHANAVIQYNINEVNVSLATRHQAVTMNLKHRSALLNNVATYLYQRGEFKLSEERAALALKIRQEIFEPGSKEILESMQCSALAIKEIGRQEEACEILRQVLEGWEKMFGPNHRRVLDALDDLARALGAMGEYAEAKQLHQRGLERARLLLDRDPQDLGLINHWTIAVYNVADDLCVQRKFVESESLLNEALDRLESINGRAQSSIWRLMRSLAITTGSLGKYEDAHALFDEVITAYKEIFGEMSPLTLSVRGQYARLLRQEGRFAEAEMEIKSVLESEIHVYGQPGIEVMLSMYDIGVYLELQEKYEEAEDMYKRLLKLQEENPQMKTADLSASDSREEIRRCLQAQGKYEEARAYGASPPNPPSTKDESEDHDAPPPDSSSTKEQTEDYDIASLSISPSKEDEPEEVKEL